MTKSAKTKTKKKGKKQGNSETNIWDNEDLNIEAWMKAQGWPKDWEKYFVNDE